MALSAKEFSTNIKISCLITFSLQFMVTGEIISPFFSTTSEISPTTIAEWKFVNSLYRYTFFSVCLFGFTKFCAVWKLCVKINFIKLLLTISSETKQIALLSRWSYRLGYDEGGILNEWGLHKKFDRFFFYFLGIDPATEASNLYVRSAVWSSPANEFLSLIAIYRSDHAIITNIPLFLWNLLEWQIELELMLTQNALLYTTNISESSFDILIIKNCV